VRTGQLTILKDQGQRHLFDGVDGADRKQRVDQLDGVAQDAALAGAQADHARIPHGRIAGHLLRPAPDHQRLAPAGVVQAPL
jgi:hypothetical protein